MSAGTVFVMDEIPTFGHLKSAGPSGLNAFSAAMQVGLGGILVFMTGVLIGSS